MKIGFLFPGQGSQYIGMGKDLYDQYEVVKKTYHQVEEITGVPVCNLSFEGDQEELNQTKNTQLCILTMSLAILKILEQEGIKAEVSSGLSLGEYAALIYSKALKEEDGIWLIKQRGEYMQELAPKGDWQMAAILGMTEEQVKQACHRVQDGFVVPVNFNAPGQIVISGERQAVEEAGNIAQAEGAKKVILLKTSGPFHTKKLAMAADALRKDLEKITFYPFETQVVKNMDGKVYKNDDDMVDILAKHIISPVRFSDGISQMLAMGVDTFVEVGPGKTLSGFVKRVKTVEPVNVLGTNSVETLQNTINFLKEGEGKNE